MAPPIVSRKDEKPPTSAAASAGTTSRVSAPADSPVMGARKIAAVAYSAPPTLQFTSSIMDVDHPEAAAVRRFSATAVVARPNRVRE